MIYNSWDWKDILKEESLHFSRFLKSRSRYSESINVQIERFMFLSAFIIRKLWDSDKLSSDVENIEVKLVSHELLNEDLFKKISPHLEDPYEYYDKNKPKNIGYDIKKLCGILIHSFFFIPELGSNWSRDIDNIFVLFNSDYQEKRLMRLCIQDWLYVCKIVYTDDIGSLSFKRNMNTLRMETIKKDRCSPIPS